MDGNGFDLKAGAFSTVLLLLRAVAPSVALAQEPAHSLQDLQSRVHIGETIRIFDPGGNRIQGSLESISDSSLRIRVGRVVREFRQPEIREVHRQFRDPITNGTVKGAVIGAIAGGAAGLLIATGEACESSSCVMQGTAIAGGLGAGLGAVSGALGDSLRKSYATIFAQSRAAGMRLGVSPILSVDTKGVRVAVRF